MSHRKHQHYAAEQLPSSNVPPKPHANSTDPIATLSTIERIRVRAHEIFQSRCGACGDALTDWNLAERQLAAEHDMPKSGR